MRWLGPLLLGVAWAYTAPTSPTPAPTRAPTLAPTTLAPTPFPTRLPTQAPTPAPTTLAPTRVPSTQYPSTSPTTAEPTPPTQSPTSSPTLSPTTSSPVTSNPTKAPTTAVPTTAAPTRAPTSNPTTKSPTSNPTTISPTTRVPTTAFPTQLPTQAPTLAPTPEPTLAPTTRMPTPPTTRAPTTSSPTQNPTRVYACPYANMSATTSIEVEDCAGRINLKNGFAVALWMRVPTNGNKKHIFHAQPPTPTPTNPGFGILASSDDVTAFLVASGSALDSPPTPIAYKFISNGVNNNIWIHMAVQWDSGTGRLQGYVNGVAVSISTVQPGTLLGTERITIGKGSQAVNVAGSSQGFEGTMNQFTLYNRLLILNEVKGLYWPGPVYYPPTTGLVLLIYEDLDAGKVVDMSPNGHSLIVLGNLTIENVRPYTLCNAPLFCGSNSSCLRTEYSGTCLAGGNECTLRNGVCMDSGAGLIKCACAPGFYGPSCSGFSASCGDPSAKVTDSYGSFNGASPNFIQVDDCTVDLTLTDFTISFWALPTVMVDFNPVFSTGDRAAGGIYVMFSAAGVQFGWGISGSNAVNFNFRCAVGVQSVVSKSWHSIVARFQKSSRIMDIWVDGTPGSNITVAQPPARLASLLIGKLTNAYYNGLLDEFRIFQRYLSNAEIAALQLGTPPATTNLLTYFAFDDVIRDEAPRASYLTPVGANIPILSATPVCRQSGVCNPDPCGNGLCGVVSNNYSCACYNSQGYFLDTSQTCSKFRNPASQCNDDAVGVSTARFRNLSDCVQFKPCMVQLATGGDFSIEVWFRRNDTSRSVIFSRGTYPSNLFLGFDAVQTLQFGWGASLATFYCGLLNSGWHHVTGVYSSGSNLLSLYIDGVFVSNFTNPGALAYSSADGLFLGCSMSPTPNYPFIGSLSQLHLYNRALSVSDISSHFVHSYTSANSAGMLMDLLLDSDTLDRASVSKNQKTRVFYPLSATPDFNFSAPLCMDSGINPCAQIKPCGANGDCRPGSTSTTYTCNCRPGFFGTNCTSPICTSNFDNFLDLTDGASSLIVQTCDASFFTGSAFTISMWVKASAGFSGPAGVFGHGDRSATGLGLGFTSSLDVTFGWGGASTSATLRCSAGEDWHLLVGVYASNILTLYMDGIASGTLVSTSGVTAYSGTARDFVIGAWRAGGVFQYFTGQIDEVRMYTIGLTSPQVIGLQTNVAPVVGSLVIYLPMTGLVELVTKSPVTSNSSIPLSLLFPVSNSRSLCFPPSPCTPNPCGVNGLCTPVGGSFNCTCPLGAQGPTCSSIYDGNSTCAAGTGTKFAYGVFNASSRAEIELTDSPLFISSLGVTGLTFAFFVNPTSNTGTFLNYANIFTVSHSYPDLLVGWQNSTKMSVCAYPYSAWRHYAVTINSGGAMVLYMNGAQVRTFNLNAAERAVDMSVFPLLTLGGTGWSGYLSNFRIYRRALASGDVSNLAQASSGYLVSPDVLIPFAFRDTSYNYRHASAGGILEYSTSNPLYIRNFGIFPQDTFPTQCRALGTDPCNNQPCNFGACTAITSASFNCTCFRGYSGQFCTDPIIGVQCPRSPYISQGYVEFPPHANATVLISGCGLQFNRKSFTFSTWVLRNVDGTYSDSLFRFASLAFRFKKPSPTTKLSYLVFTLNGASFQVLLSGWNGWRHIAGSFNYNPVADSGTLSLYLDGKAVVGATGLKKTVPVTGSLDHTGRDAWVGPETDYNYDSDPDYLQGAMSDLRLYDTLLTDQQVLYLFDNTQPSAVAVPASNLQIHILMTNATEGLTEISPNSRGVNFERYKLRVDSTRDATPNGVVLSATQDVPLCRAPNPCFPNPCVRGACTINGATFSCLCTPTFNGPTCANSVNRTTTCVTGVPHGHLQFGVSNNLSSTYALTVPRCELDFANRGFTFSGWFFAFNSPGNRVINLVAYENTLVPRLRLQGSTLSFAVSTLSNVSYTVCKFNEWIHFAAVYESSSQNITLFINGIQIASVLGQPNTSLMDLSIGRLLIGDQFRGYLSGFGIFQRALNPSEISNLQSNQFDRWDADLVLYLPLSSDLKDYSARLTDAVSIYPLDIASTTDYPLCFPSTACFPNPCNSGTCSETGGGTCRCFPGYYGARCNMSIADPTHDCLPGFVGSPHGIFGPGQTSLDVDGSATRIQTGFSISMFVRTEGLAVAQTLFANTVLGIALKWTNISTPALKFSYGSIAVSTPLWCRILGKWTHIAAVYDRGTSFLGIYLDEQLRASATGVTAAAASPIPKNSFLVGQDFVGRMDELRFYERALSISDLQAIRLNNAPTLGLDFYLPMSNISGRFHDHAGTERYTPKLVDLNTTSRFRVIGTSVVSNGEYPMCLPQALPCYPNPCAFGYCKPVPATLQPTPASYDPDLASWVNPQYNDPSWIQPSGYQCVCFPGYTGPLCGTKLEARTCGTHDNQCGVFDGTNTMDVPSTEMNFGSPGFTVSAWAYVLNTLTTQDFLRHGPDATGFNFGFLAGNLRFGYITGAAASVGLGGAVENEWHHYAATLRSLGSGNNVEYVIFIDGLRVASLNQTNWYAFVQTDITSAFKLFAGRVDNFRILNASVTDAEALSQYSTGSYSPSNTRLWLPFGSHEFPNYADNSPRHVSPLGWTALPILGSTVTPVCLDVRVAPGSVVPITGASYGAISNPDWCTTGPCSAIYAYSHSVLGFGMNLNQIDSNGLPLPPVNAFVTSVGFMTETYGRLFPCENFTVQPIYQSLQPTYFTCKTPVAGGDELQFVIEYCFYPGPCFNNTLISLNSTLLRGSTNTTFRYPQPTITPVSLIRTSVAGEAKTPLNRWTAKKSKTAETFTFLGSYFLVDKELMSISYGPVENRFLYPTSMIFGDPTYPFTENQVLFTTNATAEGFDLVFTVDVAGVTATGTDTYSYPEVPEVYSISGCNVTLVNETLNCPTYGRVLVTIIGKGFVDQKGNQLFADISGATCTNLTLISSAMLTCILPPGAGLNQAVRVFSLGFFSYPRTIVSYGLPQIARLRGGSGNVSDGNSCANSDDLNVHHCPRAAGTRLTITGENFGVSGAVIILGVRQCTNVTHTDPLYHSEVQCLMPRGNQQHQPVLLIVERGEISKSQATIGFSPCPPGFFENSTNQLCDQCKLGEYSSTEGAIGSCPPCLPGSISTGLGASECELCNRGQYQEDAGKTECLACEPGKFAGTKGQDVCSSCLPGKANLATPQDDSSKCAECAQGRIQPLSGKSTCDACPAGKTSNSQLLACAQCVPGSAAPKPAATQCVLCPVNSYSSPETINCECEVGMYGYFRGNFTLEYNPEKVVCVKCPFGAACNKQGIWEWNIPSLPGYWHKSNEALNFEPCLFDSHCPGQFSANDTGCANNRFGLLCANCLPGYKSTGGAAPCDQCPEAVGESWGWSVLFVIGIFLGLAVVYAVVLRADAQQDRAFNGKIGEVKLSSLPPILNMGDASVLTTNLVLTEENQRTSRFTSTLKIVVGFFQICTSLSVFNDVKLPSYYATFIGVFNVINLDFVPWTSLSCVANFNFFTKTLLTGFIPIILIGSCTAGFFGWYKIAQARDFSDDPEPRKRRKGYRLKFWKLLLFTLFLLYPSVSSSLLRYFVCRQIDFSYYLLADLNMACGPGIWLDNLPYAALFVLVYPIGIPTMFFILMFRRRTKLRRVNTIQTYAFLYQAYIEKVWFFEEIEMVHKLIMTSILQFFPGAMRFQAGMVVTYIYICAILLVSPYVQKKNEILAIICEIEIMLLLLAGNAMTAEGQLPVGSFLDVLLSILLIGATIFAVLLFVATAIHHARQNYWTKKRLHAEKAGKRSRKSPHELEASEVSASSKNSEGVSEIDDSDLGESDNIKTAREAQEAMQDALQSTLSEQIVPFYMVVIESVATIWDDLRRKPCCEVIMKQVHRFGDPCGNWVKRGWDNFIRLGQGMLNKLGCIKCAAYFRRLTCGTCCEKRKAGKPKLYTSAMMELMLPEARHHRSASEHLLRTVGDAAKADASSSLLEDDEGKFEVALSPVSEPKILKSALKKPKESDELRSPDNKPAKPRKLTVDERGVVGAAPESKPSKPRKLTVDEHNVVKAAAENKPSKPRKLTIDEMKTVKTTSPPLSPKETSPPEEKKAPTKQADAAAGLAAKMAAKLASKKAQADNPPIATQKPETVSVAKSPTDSKPSEAKEESVQIAAPENRPMTKSIAEGRPGGETDKPNKPAKPGRARGPTNTTTPTQTASPS